MDWKYLKYDLEYKWENFKFRQWIKNNPLAVIITTGVSVFIFLIILVVLFWPTGTSAEFKPKQVWYYDLNTGKLFASTSGQNPPVEAPSGPLPDGQHAGVLAHVYKDRTDINSEPFIAFLETLTPDAQKTRPTSLGPANERTEQEVKIWNQGRLVKRVEDDQWVAYDSRQGEQILEEVSVRFERRLEYQYFYPEK